MFAVVEFGCRMVRSVVGLMGQAVTAEAEAEAGVMTFKV